ncbi:MAG: single-stranded-DNA-specific exonuclease RecJ [Trueperaceae bacterium]
MRAPAPIDAVARLSATLRIHPQLAAMLWARGLRDDAADHLDPAFAPTEIPDLDRAADRLIDALERGRRVRIHGDYDADGITGTALLTLGLRALGGRVEPFVPHRILDGYGIHPDRVAEHVAAADLLLTVDCGIGNLSEIEALQRAGLEVIVSDHHAPGTRLPDCLIVHPATSPLAQRGLPQLTGAGIAYHLLWAIHRKLGLPDPVEYADLAAIGTIADVAPLLGENRALVKLGLERLRESSWPGVRATLSLARLRGAPTARDVAFVLAPRINAAGRLGEAELALELLTTASERRGLELATLLDQRNRDRKKVQDAMFDRLAPTVDPGAPAIVVADPEGHPGVMGIVASQLLERFYKPVYIVAKGKGSVRSTPGISAVGGLAAAAPHLLRWGGHPQAAGFALEMERFDAFRDAVLAFVDRHPTPVPSVVADAIVGLDEVGADLHAALQALEPYGEGHAPPTLLLRGSARSARAVGNAGAHLQLRLGDANGAEVKGVAWRHGALADALGRTGAVDAAAVLVPNEWNGRTTIEFQAHAVRAAGPLTLDGAPPEAAPRLARGAGRASEVPEVPGVPDVPIDPRADDPFDVLRTALARGPARVRLDAAALALLEGEADAWPTVTDVRTAWVALGRGHRPPFGGPLADRTVAVLEELALVDARGRGVRGRKVEPYASERLRAGLVRRYALRTFVHAYRHLDDAGFDAAVRSLLDDGALPPGRAG